MKHLRVFLIIVMVGVTIAGVPAARADDPAQVGQFSAPFQPPNGLLGTEPNPPAVGIAMMPDGRVVYWGGLTGLEASNPSSAIDGRASKAASSLVMNLSGSTPQWQVPVTQPGRLASRASTAATSECCPTGAS